MYAKTETYNFPFLWTMIYDTKSLQKSLSLELQEAGSHSTSICCVFFSAFFFQYVIMENPRRLRLRSNYLKINSNRAPLSRIDCYSDYRRKNEIFFAVIQRKGVISLIGGNNSFDEWTFARHSQSLFYEKSSEQQRRMRNCLKSSQVSLKWLKAHKMFNCNYGREGGGESGATATLV